jgi:hypothetical protein
MKLVRGCVEWEVAVHNGGESGGGHGDSPADGGAWEISYA